MADRIMSLGRTLPNARALHWSTLVFRLFNVFTFVYASWLFKDSSHWGACPVNLGVPSTTTRTVPLHWS